MTQTKAGTITSTPAVVSQDGSNVSGNVIVGSWNGQRVGPAFVPSPGSAGYGTVTSVALTAPSILSVAGSPVTASGTFALTLATQAANVVFAGPTSGGAVAPAFRALVAADIPTISAAQVSGLAASATTDTTVATNITSGTLPSGRLTGAYTGITGLGTLTSVLNVSAAGSATAAAIGVGEANTGWFLGAAHKLTATSNGQANGPTIYHDGTRYRTEFPTVGNWLTWNNGTNGVVLLSPTFGSANDGIVQILGFGGADGGVDLGSSVRLKGTSSALFVRNQTDNADANVNCAVLSASTSVSPTFLNFKDGSGNGKVQAGYITANNAVNVLQLMSNTGGSAPVTTHLSDAAIARSLYVEARGSSNFSGGGFSWYSDTVITNAGTATVTMTLPAPVGKGRFMHFAVATGGGTFTVTSATGSQIYKTAGSAAVASVASTSGVGAYIVLGDFDGTGWTIMAQQGTWA